MPGQVPRRGPRWCGASTGRWNTTKSAAKYLHAIPIRHYRLRLAVAWPLLMGLGTLAELAKNREWLDPSSRSKVSRGWVYRMMGVSGVRVMSNRLIAGWVERLRGEIVRAL